MLGIRPEAFEDAAFADSGLPQIDATPTVLEELGPDVHVIFGVDAKPVRTDDVREAAEDDETALLLSDQAVFNARVDVHTSAEVRRPMRLAVDPGRFHFFDLESGLNVTGGAVARALAV